MSSCLHFVLAEIDLRTATYGSDLEGFMVPPQYDTGPSPFMDQNEGEKESEDCDCGTWFKYDDGKNEMTIPFEYDEEPPFTGDV